ncbi:MAG: pyruvate, phosphate dikinase [Burkholderiales bacterium]|nr:pyruvate, phosphate dikinase [Burkholderiales bacterium]
MRLPDTFAIGSAAAAAATPSVIGAKGWHLARMAALDLPVPPAFVIGTRHCPAGDGGGASAEVRAALPELLAPVEAATARRFADARCPLLVSVRSGAPASMPGMMQTLLNVGLSERTLPGLLRVTGNPRLAWDAYRRLIAQFGEVVARVPVEAFEDARCALAGGGDERGLDFAQLRALASRFLAVYREAAGEPFPQDEREQLERAVAAVFASWRSPHAVRYRRAHDIPEVPGTAVIVQAMVFGNAGGRSGAGVGFTRDPTTGAPALWVDFLANAQGEDIVSGRRVAHGATQLATAVPDAWAGIAAAARQLEHAFGDMQDFEFTVEDGRLYLLQSRAGKRSALAALRILLDLHDEGVIDAATALTRAEALDPASLVVARVVAEDGNGLAPLAQAASANTGVAIGEIALDEARAQARTDAGASVVLVRRDAETADLAALALAQGLLTQRGARTSHAAVVARQLGKVCLVGCGALAIDAAARRVHVGGRVLAEGDVVTLDGNTGSVYAGAARTVAERPLTLLARLATLMEARGGTRDGRTPAQVDAPVPAR